MHRHLHERFPLRPGNHPTREHGMCAMEMVAWLAGEPHSDEPACACPVLGALVRTFNDVVPDVETRNRHVRVLVPRLIHTNDGDAVARRRAFVALDRAVRRLAPLSLAARGDHDGAARLRGLERIACEASARRAAHVLRGYGRTLHAAWWTASRAADGVPCKLWISGVVHVAKPTRAWSELQRIVEAMIGVRPARVPAR